MLILAEHGEAIIADLRKAMWIDIALLGDDKMRSIKEIIDYTIRKQKI